MTTVIHKQSIFPEPTKIVDTIEVYFPRSARILTIAGQRGIPTVWYECDLHDTDGKATLRRYRIVGTGSEVEQRPHEHTEYRATVVGDYFVWHVYEVTTT